MSKKKTIDSAEIGDIVKSRNQMFTYSENKLLDQITIEVMEAWKKDLLMIKKHYQNLSESSDLVCKSRDSLFTIACQLSEMANNVNFITKLTEVFDTIKSMNEYLNSLQKDIYEVTKKLDYSEMKSIMNSMKEVNINFDNINKHLSLIKTKKWWEFWR